MDLLPNMKTNITVIVTLAFNVLNISDVINVPPETVAAVNSGLLALVGLFIAMRVKRAG